MEQHSRTIANARFIPQIYEFLREGRTTRFRVQGWSMRPFVEHERDEVLLAPCSPSQLKVGDVVLAEVAPQQYVLHRIVNVQGNALVLQGDGNVGTVERCGREAVMGIALGFYRKGRKTPDLCRGVKWKLYSVIWLSLTPIRRYLLAAYRRLWLRWFPPL